MVLLLWSFASTAWALGPEPAVARALSVGSTMVPVTGGLLLLLTDDGTNSDNRLTVGTGLVTVGAAVGPSVGQWYAGGGSDAWVVFGLRTLSSGMTGAGIGLRFRGDEGTEGLGVALMSIGGVITAALAAYDFVAAGDTARERRYESGFARTEPRLLEVARCGAFPCNARLSR
jgi:hypothetical protein